MPAELHSSWAASSFILYFLTLSDVLHVLLVTSRCFAVFLHVQGAPLMKKVGMFTDEVLILQSSIYVHRLQCLLRRQF